MRAVRSTFSIAIAIGLLAGPTVGITAQEEEASSPTPDPMRAAWVTGTCPWSGTQVGSPTVTDEIGVITSYGERWEGFFPCDMSASRLIGTGRAI
jgi:hypothetical protein